MNFISLVRYKYDTKNIGKCVFYKAFVFEMIKTCKGTTVSDMLEIVVLFCKRRFYFEGAISIFKGL